jgi:acetolactate decarboxylase
VVNPPQPGTRLDAAAMAQSELSFADIDGSLVGLWSPGFISAFCVAGDYFNFLSADRHRGGRLFDAEADRLELKNAPARRGSCWKRCAGSVPRRAICIGP